MGIFNSKKTTDTEKRFKTIRAQLYGKEPLQNGSRSYIYNSNSNTEPAKTINQASLLELSYLKKDLLKILILATLIFLTQTIIYFGSKTLFWGKIF